MVLRLKCIAMAMVENSFIPEKYGIHDNSSQFYTHQQKESANKNQPLESCWL